MHTITRRTMLAALAGMLALAAEPASVVRAEPGAPHRYLVAVSGMT
jgi:hypothetical protein